MERRRLAGAMQLALGSARVSRAADGVPPEASCPPFGLTVRFSKMERLSLRRDAANHTPEAYAPQFLSHGSGSGFMGIYN